MHHVCRAGRFHRLQRPIFRKSWCIVGPLRKSCSMVADVTPTMSFSGPCVPESRARFASLTIRLLYIHKVEFHQFVPHDGPFAAIQDGRAWNHAGKRLLPCPCAQRCACATASAASLPRSNPNSRKLDQARVRHQVQQSMQPESVREKERTDIKAYCVLS